MSAPVFVPDEIVAALKINDLPKGVLGWSPITADSASVGGTLTDITGLSVDVDVESARLIRVSVFVGAATPTVLGDRFNLMIREGSTQLARQIRRFNAANAEAGFLVQAVLVPTGGAHTYKTSLQRAAGTGALVLEAAADEPAFILVEDLGGDPNA